MAPRVYYYTKFAPTSGHVIGVLTAASARGDTRGISGHIRTSTLKGCVSSEPMSDQCGIDVCSDICLVSLAGGAMSHGG
eukprot:3630037-Pyramimonas_sp.AAC.1